MKKCLLLLLLIVLVFLQMTNAQTPVAYYPLNGNANDASGNALNGTINGIVTPTTDRFGNPNSAMSFPGNTSSFIQIADNPLLRPTSITISCWVNVAGGGLNTFVQKALSPCINDGWFSGTESGNFRCYVSNSFTCGDQVSTSSAQINNVWKFIVFTVDVVADTRNLYVDGVLVATGAFTSTLQYDSNPVLLGAHLENGFLAFPLLGSLDDIKIYNTALTAAQVQQEYLSTNNYSSQFGNSVQMNGTNDQIELGSTYTQQIFTVEMWVKPGATQVQYANIIDNNHTGTTNWVCQQNASNTNLYGFGVNTNGVTAGVEFQLQPNVWQHIALIRDATVVQVYVNGILVQSNNISGTNIFSGQFLRLGNWGGGGRNWNGTMDEVRYWNTARTQAEIVANMNSQLAGTEVGLIGYWDMNRSGQGTGLTVENKCVATGAALNGTTVGTASTPIFALGITQQKSGSGNAISFDGVDDNISATTTGYTGIQTYTIECWIKSNAANPTVHIWESNSLSAPSLEGEASGGLGLRFYVGGSNSINTGVLNIGQWYHVACVYDKANTLQSLYVNGVLKGTNTVNVSDVIGANMGFGERLFGSPNNRFFNGELDEVRIWNTALTQSQIRDRMCRKITSSDALYTNLVAYYNFDESTGNTAFDGTGNANDGTLNNAPARVTSGAAIGTASSHDYVNATKTTSLTHPTGESFTVTSTSGNPDGIHVYRVDEKPSDLTGASGVGANDKYFGVFQVSGTTPQYTAVYNYNGNPTINAGNESPLRLNRRTDNAATSWTTMSALPNEAANTITVTGESTEYILGSIGNPLPLNLISFAGTKTNNNALLQWRTASEVNVSRFELQRSENGQNFVSIGTVSAGGNNYSYTDAGVFNTKQTVYYRLKSVDIDGRFTQSSIIRLQKTGTGLITVFPNPATDKIAISDLKQSGIVRLYDGTGQLLQQKVITAQTVTMDLSGYAKGMYLLQYAVEGEISNLKIIRQ